MANHPQRSLRREFPGGQKPRRGTPEYWDLVSQYGVPHIDRDRITCEGDSGHGPCGRYRQWYDGMCARGHPITFT